MLFSGGGLALAFLSFGVLGTPWNLEDRGTSFFLFSFFINCSSFFLKSILSKIFSFPPLYVFKDIPIKVPSLYHAIFFYEPHDPNVRSFYFNNSVTL